MGHPCVLESLHIFLFNILNNSEEAAIIIKLMVLRRTLARIRAQGKKQPDLDLNPDLSEINSCSLPLSTCQTG